MNGVSTALLLRFDCLIMWLSFYTKKMHYFNCEIEGFVEAHICKLCVILRSRVLLSVYLRI